MMRKDGDFRHRVDFDQPAGISEPGDKHDRDGRRDSDPTPLFLEGLKTVRRILPLQDMDAELDDIIRFSSRRRQYFIDIPQDLPRLFFQVRSDDIPALIDGVLPADVNGLSVARHRDGVGIASRLGHVVGIDGVDVHMISS
jgi:hypothetical protein